MFPLLGCVLYVGTGVLQPVIIDWLRLQDALGRRYLLLPTLAGTMGMGACGLLVPRSQWKTVKINWPRLLQATLVDLASGMLLSGGLLLTGGGVFVVLYNSVPVWAATQARIFLGKRLALKQMIGVALVSFGLASTVFGSPRHRVVEDDPNVTRISIGSGMVLLGSFLHATMFILSETALKASSNPLPSKIWCSLMGSIEACFMATWVLVGTAVWGFRDLHTNDAEEQQQNETSPITIGLGFLALFAVDVVHAAAFFSLLKKLGAVGSALLKGIQTITVVIISAILFCGQEEAQCLTTGKSIGLLLVLGGLGLYASAGGRTKVPQGKYKDIKDTESMLS